MGSMTYLILIDTVYSALFYFTFNIFSFIFISQICFFVVFFSFFSVFFMSNFVRQDTDKYWYIDYIENIESLFNTGVEQIEYLMTAYNFIKESLSQNPEGKVNEKYQWLKRKYNPVAEDILKNDKLKNTDYELYLCTREIKLLN